MPKTRPICAGFLAALLLGIGIVSVGDYMQPRPAAAAVNCSALSQRIYQRVNPSTQANLLTASATKASASTKQGFTVNRGTPFKASAKAGAGLVAVHRLSNKKSGDLVWISGPGEIAGAIKKYGYTDAGVDFFASPTSSSCLIPVYRFLKRDKHRHAVSATDRKALIKAGWREEGISFYAAPATPAAKPTKPTGPAKSTDTKFSIAVLPDTQQEVLSASDPRFAGRSTWLAAHKSSLDLRFVAQVGDLVNWDTPDHFQYRRASAAMRVLNQASIPYAIAIGNHDSQATCPGGSACPGRNIKLAARDTTTFNRYFPESSFARLQGQFEPGKMDNSFQTFSAGGKQFLVLTLELWPRTAAINWAKFVVASHPKYNVIVLTHSYLTASGGISASNGGYGANSPKYLYDHLIKQYPNIRLVLSGHTGKAAARQDAGVHGNKIISYLQTFHDNRTNPTRLIEIDMKAKTIRSWIYSPFSQTKYPQYDSKISGMGWIG